MTTFSMDLPPIVWQVGVPALVAGLVIGLITGWLIGAARRRSLERRNFLLETRLGSEEELQDERDRAFDAAVGQLTAAFAELSNQSLRSNSETFLRLAEQHLGVHQERAKRDLGERQQAIESLVRPVREALDATREQMTALEKARSEAYGNIHAQLESMQRGQSELARETQNLVNALRRPQVRGRWGELTLRRLVELAGMVEHCDFREQVHSDGDEQAIRPDVVVRMPDDRELVVDVKTPLEAYLDANEAADEAQRKQALQRHARNVREHVRKLSSKAYWRQFDRSPEFVILFIPGDQFLAAALNEHPELIEEALSRQIILATPTSFVALLKAIAYGWRQLSMAENAVQIRRLAEDLYARLGVFVEHLDRIGRQLGNSVDSYNRAIGSLERKVLPGARKFVELGVTTHKDLADPSPIEATPRHPTPVADDDTDARSAPERHPDDESSQ